MGRHWNKRSPVIGFADSCEDNSSSTPFEVEFWDYSPQPDVQDKFRGPLNWTGLPTELKEHIIQYCVYDPRDLKSFAQQALRKRIRTTTGFGASRELGLYEIVDKLTQWSSLLHVSRQVRTIVLRLCFIGQKDQVEKSGFCIASASYHGLAKTMSRLGRYYQLMELDAIPIDEKTKVLAKAYKYYPRIYPELKQYATFLHAIRTLCIEMKFIRYMHFFRVKVGSFEQHLDPTSMSYHTFDQLPNLDKVIINLPGKPQEGWRDATWHEGPQIFHNDSPCPRILHRVIYERAAAVLAPYKSIRMKGFMDDDEKQHFYELRAAAQKELRFTEQDFEELYAECGGGVQLDEIVQPGAGTSVGEADEDVRSLCGGVDHFFPPKCLCAESCEVASIWDTRISLSDCLL